MPKNPINYCNCVIYKIVCRDILIVEKYVGSTTNFKARKNQHKGACRNEKSKCHNYKLYKFIRNSGGWENWDMVEVHRQSCTDSLELHKIERNYIELLGATLNYSIPCRTPEEWRDCNKDYKVTYDKEYREKNKEKEIINNKEYYILNKDRILLATKTYRENNKEKISIKGKKYRENNVDKRAKYAKEYFAENKEKRDEYLKKYNENHLEEIKEQRNKRYICECGKDLLCIGKSRHLKSNIHKNNLKNLLSNIDI
jgi:hypothetical protein